MCGGPSLNIQIPTLSQIGDGANTIFNPAGSSNPTARAVGRTALAVGAGGAVIGAAAAPAADAGVGASAAATAITSDTTAAALSDSGIGANSLSPSTSYLGTIGSDAAVPDSASTLTSGLPSITDPTAAGGGSVLSDAGVSPGATTTALAPGATPTATGLAASGSGGFLSSIGAFGSSVIGAVATNKIVNALTPAPAQPGHVEAPGSPTSGSAPQFAIPGNKAGSGGGVGTQPLQASVLGNIGGYGIPLLALGFGIYFYTKKRKK